jgi:hypothetical protein
LSSSDVARLLPPFTSSDQEEHVEVKVFDPMNEEAVQAWLKTPPGKQIIEGAVYQAHVGGMAREVGIVLYVEEHTVGHPESE